MQKAFQKNACLGKEQVTMKIQYMTCPRCGGEIHTEDLNKIHYCSYCGAPLLIDDEVERSVQTTVIRDEARLKEAENEARRLDLEEQRHQVIFAVMGIVLLTAGALCYVMSPIDFMSGIALDDIVVICLCVKALRKIGKKLERSRM